MISRLFFSVLIFVFLLSTLVIANSSPSIPNVYHDNVLVEDGFELFEDETYILIFNATDPDGDVLIYSFAPPTPPFCTLDQELDYGVVTCEVLHEHVSVSGTSDFGPEEVKYFVISFQATERFGTEKLASIRDINFSLVPVNDQAVFTNPLSDITIDALDPWSYQLFGVDEELDYPLNFSVSADPILGLHFIDVTDTSATLTFPGGMPYNNQSGSYVVFVNLTDNGSSSQHPSSFSFNLTINRTNEPPFFITNFSNITGTQGQPFLFDIEARDPDENDTLSFSIERDTSQSGYCSSDLFHWDTHLTVLNDNATDALARINVANLTNDYVVCRYLILIVEDDYGNRVEVPVFFNITNINDPPVVHEISNYPGNAYGQNNLSNLSIGMFSPSATFKVNASDPDQLTYDALNTGVLNFTTNNSNFSIHPVEGILDLEFTNDSMVGIHHVEIIVTDNGGLSGSRVMTIEIIENNPPFIEVLPQSLVFNQTDDLIIYFNTTDQEGDHVYLEFISNALRFNVSIYESSLMLVSSDVSNPPVNVSMWALNLSHYVEQKYLEAPLPRPERELYSNALVGLHNVSIRAYDSQGAHSPSSSRANVVFVIENENDAPFFDMEQNNATDVDNFTFSPMVADKLYYELIYVTDFDLFLPLDIFVEELFFSVVNYSDLDVHNFSKLQGFEDVANLSFTPLSSGEHFITLSVVDLAGAGENLTINFTVYEETDPPNILQVMPYFDVNETVEDFISTSLVSSPLFVEWVEDSYLTFDAEIEIVDVTFSNNVDNYLDVEWFLNGVSLAYLENVVSMSNSSIDVYFDFFSSGFNNVTLVAYDAVKSSANWTWGVYVENVNRPPTFCPGSLDDIRFSGSTTRTHYFSYSGYQRFYDPDDDPQNTGLVSITLCNTSRDFGILPYLRELPSLTFALHNTTSGFCDADFVFNGPNLTIVGYTQGMCRVIFSATDDYGEVALSDIVEIEILESQQREEVFRERIVTVTEQVTIPLEERVDVPRLTKIIYPGELVFYYNRTVEVPLVILNNWTEPIRGISLSASALNLSSHDDNLSFSFSVSFIESLAIGESRNVSLFLSNYRALSPLLITILAEVSEPDFVDSESLIIAGLEMAGDDPQSVRALVTYARDLLSSSPQCAELNDLLDNAQRVLEQGSVQEALRLIDAAINGCTYLLSEDELLRREQPGSLRTGLDFTSQYWSEIVFSSIALIFIAIVFYVLAFFKFSFKNK